MVILLAGCRPPAQPDSKVAPVSGTVQLVGEPIEGVKVLFVPLDLDKDGQLGPVAFAVTDAKGHYTLAHRGGHGAAIGRNQVWLTTRNVEKQKSADGVVEVAETGSERLPAKYNESTELVFDVPETGTDKADFDLESESGR